MSAALASTGLSGANVASDGAIPAFSSVALIRELAPAAAGAGESLSLQVCGRADRRIRADQDGLRPRIRLGAADRLDRRPGRDGGEEGEVAGVADIEGAGVERLQDRRGGGEFRPLDPVGQILRVAGDLEERPVPALLVADPQDDLLRAGGHRGQRRHGQRQCSGEQRPGEPAAAGTRVRSDEHEACHDPLPELCGTVLWRADFMLAARTVNEKKICIVRGRCAR